MLGDRGSGAAAGAEGVVVQVGARCLPLRLPGFLPAHRGDSGAITDKVISDSLTPKPCLDTVSGRFLSWGNCAFPSSARTGPAGVCGVAGRSKSDRLGSAEISVH